MTCTNARGGGEAGGPAAEACDQLAAVWSRSRRRRWSPASAMLNFEANQCEGLTLWCYGPTFALQRCR